MVIDIKLCRFDNVPWGFRLVGGSDFEVPLTVVKVTEGSIAEEAGLKVGDIIVRINDTAATPLVHEEANQIIRHCGNVFYFGVHRDAPEEEEISDAKRFPIIGEDRPRTPESFLDVSSSCKSPLSENFHHDEFYSTSELGDRPSSVLSENTEIKLVEEEIAAVLSGESEVLKQHNVMGIFPKPGVCMSSDVLRTLNEDAIKTKAEKEKENRKWTTFLQKPDRPIPKSKAQIEAERRAANAYKVKITKSIPRTPERAPSPAPPTEPQAEPMPPAEPEPEPEPEPPVEEPLPTDSEVPNLEAAADTIDEQGAEDDKKDDEKKESSTEPKETSSESPANEQQESAPEETPGITNEPEQQEQQPPAPAKTAEELALEKQLADVQKQLAALSSLPSTIQATLDAVTKQLGDLLPTFRLQQEINTLQMELQAPSMDDVHKNEPREINLENIDEEEHEELKDGDDDNEEFGELEQQMQPGIETDEGKPEAKIDGDSWQAEMAPRFDEEQSLKKQKRHDVIEELEEHLERKTQNYRRSKRAFGPLTPSSERPMVLPGGRRWYRPKDAYNDEFIAETLSAQAELIAGTALGCNYESPLLGFDSREFHSVCVAKQVERQRVNFMKYQKPEKKIDLNRSEVYKVIHHLDRQPVRGIEVRPPVVPAEVDIRKSVQTS